MTPPELGVCGNQVGRKQTRPQGLWFFQVGVKPRSLMYPHTQAPRGLTLRLRAFLLALLLFFTLLALTVILFLYFLPHAGENRLQDNGVFIDLGGDTGSNGLGPDAGLPVHPTPP